MRRSRTCARPSPCSTDPTGSVFGSSVGYEASCGVKPERGRVAGQDPHDYRTRAVASQLLERGLKKRSPDVLALVGGRDVDQGDLSGIVRNIRVAR